MKKVLFTLMAVMTISSVSFAGLVNYTVDSGPVVIDYRIQNDDEPPQWVDLTYTTSWQAVVQEIENGSDLLATYRVTLIPENYGITSITDITAYGVHQEMDALGNHFATDESAYLPVMTTDNGIFDTHILYSNVLAQGTGVQPAGNGWTETCDKSNPYGVSANAGMGDLILDSDASTLASKNPTGDLSSLEFLQVVLPYGVETTVTGLFNSDEAAYGPTYLDRKPMVPFSITVGGTAAEVPEPSTIVMLVLGALCLIGARRRK